MNLQSTWRGERALPNTYYSCSENGWMTTKIFQSWFPRFLKAVEERPLLLILDGHLTHVSIEIIEMARESDVTIVKLPPHVTDKLQPLDVSCFGPLKRLWERVLNDHVSVWGTKEPMQRHVFCNLISEVWHKGLTPDNIVAGFKACGVYPLDRERYPTDRFDIRKLNNYREWVHKG